MWLSVRKYRNISFAMPCLAAGRPGYSCPGNYRYAKKKLSPDAERLRKMKPVGFLYSNVCIRQSAICGNILYVSFTSNSLS